jgi:hypothetical protein
MKTLGLRVEYSSEQGHLSLINEMKSIKFLNEFKLKFSLRDSILPVDKNFKSSLSSLLKGIGKILYIVLDTSSSKRIRDRLVIANNFLQFVYKMYRNHGGHFTIK